MYQCRHDGENRRWHEGLRISRVRGVSRAVASDLALTPQTLELLWETSGRDANLTARAISTQSVAPRFALAHLFVGRDATAHELSEQKLAVSKAALLPGGS